MAVVDINESTRRENFTDDNYLFLNCDITDVNAVKKAYGIIVKKFGKIDSLINCAGVLSVGKLISRNPNMVLNP